MRNVFVSLGVLFVTCSAVHAGNWPAWRGPQGDGTSDEKDPPISWSAMENVTWSTKLPGPGNSTPIVWDDRIFVTGAENHGAIRSLMCFDRDSGKLLWKGKTEFGGVEPTHAESPYCSATPATDGKVVYASLASAGVVAYDFSGKQIWKQDIGPLNHIWGNAGSPLLYKGAVILNCGPGPRCFLIALDKQTGKPLWKHDLPDSAGKPDEFKGSWSSPVLADIDGASQLIVDLPGHVAGFNPENGEELWRCNGLGQLAYVNPLVGKNVIIGMAGYGGPALGMRTPKSSDRGDLTQSHRLWVVSNNQQRIGSGILIGDRAYILNEPGILQCIDAATGKLIWKGRGTGSSWSSTEYVDGKLFSTDQTGETIVWTPGDKLEIVKRNPIGEHTRGSLVFSDGQVFLRTYENLYCFGKRRHVQ